MKFGLRYNSNELPKAAYFVQATKDSASLAPEYVRDKTIILPVRQQGCCGSCYAISLASCINERLMHRGIHNVKVHENSILKLYGDAFNGCSGGLVTGFSFGNFMSTQGLPTLTDELFVSQIPIESLESSSVTCKNVVTVDEPALRRWCKHNVPYSAYENCFQSYYFYDKLEQLKFEKKLLSEWSVTTDENVIKEQILSGGVVFTMKVIESFINFDSECWQNCTIKIGNFRFSKAFSLGRVAALTEQAFYHAVTAVGWITTTEEQLPGHAGLYWVLKNSWGTQWADEGFCLVAAASLTPTSSNFIPNAYVAGGRTTNDMMVVTFPKKLSTVDRSTIAEEEPDRQILRHRWRVDMWVQVVFVVAGIVMVAAQVLMFSSK